MPLRRPPLIDQPIQMICPSAPNQDGGLSLMAPPKGPLLAVATAATALPIDQPIQMICPPGRCLLCGGAAATVVSENPYQFVVRNGLKRCVQVGGLAKH